MTLQETPGSVPAGRVPRYKGYYTMASYVVELILIHILEVLLRTFLLPYI